MGSQSRGQQPLSITPPALHRSYSAYPDRQPKARTGKVLLHGVVIPQSLDKPMSEVVFSIDAHRIPLGKNGSEDLERLLQCIGDRIIDWDQVEDLQGHQWRQRTTPLTSKKGEELKPPSPAWPPGPEGPELVKAIVMEGQPISSIWTEGAPASSNGGWPANMDMWPPQLNVDSLQLNASVCCQAMDMANMTGTLSPSLTQGACGSFLLLYNKSSSHKTGELGMSDVTPLIPAMRTFNLRAMSFLRGISEGGNQNTEMVSEGSKPPKIVSLSGNVLVLKKKLFDDSKRHLILHQDVTISEIVAACGKYPVISQEEASWMATDPQVLRGSYGVIPHATASRSHLADNIDISIPPGFPPAMTFDETGYGGAIGSVYGDLFEMSVAQMAGYGGTNTSTGGAGGTPQTNGGNPGVSSMWLGSTGEGDQAQIVADAPLEPEVCAAVVQQFADQLIRALPVFQKAASGLILTGLGAGTGRPGEGNHELTFMRTVLEDTLALNAKLSHEVTRCRHLISRVFEENSRLRMQLRSSLCQQISSINTQQSTVNPTVDRNRDWSTDMTSVLETDAAAHQFSARSMEGSSSLARHHNVTASNQQQQHQHTALSYADPRVQLAMGHTTGSTPRSAAVSGGAGGPASQIVNHPSSSTTGVGGAGQVGGSTGASTAIVGPSSISSVGAHSAGQKIQTQLNAAGFGGNREAASSSGKPTVLAKVTTPFDASTMKEPDQFARLRKDDTVRIVYEDKSGWWKVASIQKNDVGINPILGWYPSSYLSKQ